MKSLSMKVYRLLLKLYPAGFREEYSGPLERQFRDEAGEVQTNPELARLWLRTLADFAISLPMQLAREMWQDARHAMRMWARRPLPTVLAVAALAIGIGANVGVFTVVNAILLRSLPFREPDRLAEMSMFFPVPIGGSSAAFHDWRRQCSYLDDAALYTVNEMNLRGARKSARVVVTQASWNFLRMYGTKPALGRTFRPEEDTPGRDAVAVIGYGLWQQLFGGSPGVLGSTLHINEVPFTVVGVAPPGFDYPKKTAIWTPAAFDLQRIQWSGVMALHADGRLKHGLSWAQARQAFDAEVKRRKPERMKFGGEENRPKLIPLREQLAGPVEHASLVLMGAVALVLLIACANVANLLLARTVDRSGELLIRSALGASRARLTQQLLTECVLLSAIAGASGLVVARWMAAVATTAQPGALATQAYMIGDWRVLGFTSALSLATGVLFGVLPALHVGRVRAAAVVRSANARRGNARLRWALVAVQVSLSVVLLTGSLVLGRAFLKMMGTDCGYEVRNAVTVSISLAGTRYGKEDDRARTYYDEAFRRIRVLPGVRAAGGTGYLPLGTDTFMAGGFSVEGGARAEMALQIPVAPAFFRAIGGRVLHGREFQEGDERSSEQPAIVSDWFLHHSPDSGSPVGKRLVPREGKPLKIIGVVRNLYMAGPEAGDDQLPQVFTLATAPNFLTFVVRVQGDPRDAVAAVRHAVQSVDPQIPVFDAKTMEERLAEATARPAFYTTAVLFFGGFGLMLAVIGIYGVVSYAVAQRMHEIGIRLALGTTAAHLRRGLLFQGLAAVLAGAAPGIAGSYAAGRYLQSLIDGAEPVGALVCAGAVLLLAVVAAASLWAATRRVARLDLAVLLRAE